MMRPSPAEEFDVGTVVARTYEVVRLLGRGGMGSVWEARHLRLPGKQVAIKVLHASVVGDTEALARFRREAEIACRLGHPNIVEVHDFNKLDNGSPYLILEMLKGQGLDEYFLSRGRISLKGCENILSQIGSALSCAHAQGVIHRDLKPQNIFMVPNPSGGPDIVKLLDFGISKIRGSETVKTQESSLLGTPQYMAPEQAIGNHKCVDARTDIFALASMVYELLCGAPAFGGESIPEVVYKVVHQEPRPIAELLPSLPQDKIAALHKALQKAQEDRFDNVGDFVEAFVGTPISLRGNMTPGQWGDPAGMGDAQTVDSQRIDLNIGNAATMDSGAVERTESVQQAARAQASLGTEDTMMPAGIAVQVVAGGDTKILDPHVSVHTAVVKRRIPILWGSVFAVFAVSLGGFLIWNSSAKVVAPVQVHGVADVVDAAVAVAVAEVVDAGGIAQASDAAVQVPKPPEDHRTPREPAASRSPASSSKSRNPKVKAHIASAETAIADGKPGLAIREATLANQIQQSKTATLILGRAYCLKKDLTMVNAILRKLPSRQKRQLRKFCKSHNFELP